MDGHYHSRKRDTKKDKYMIALTNKELQGKAKIWSLETNQRVHRGIVLEEGKDIHHADQLKIIALDLGTRWK